MHRRDFITTVGSAVGLAPLACAGGTAARGTGTRRLRRVGVQLYSLRDDARRDLEQETYPGTPLDSVRRDFAYISRLQF